MTATKRRRSAPAGPSPLNIATTTTTPEYPRAVTQCLRTISRELDGRIRGMEERLEAMEQRFDHGLGRVPR